MLRLLLMILALLVLLAVVLVWMGAIDLQKTDSGVNVSVNPVEVGVEPRNVTVPVPVIERPGEAAPANQAQPAPQH